MARFKCLIDVVYVRADGICRYCSKYEAKDRYSTVIMDFLRQFDAM